MHQSIHSDDRVRSLRWRDLVKPSRTQVMTELLLVTPWLALSFLSADFANTTHWGFYIFALGFSFVFFLTGLRVVHNAYHFTLGIPRFATHCVTFCLSVLLCWPLHAVQVNHLRHHRYCMSDKDTEAASAHMTAWQAILFGPAFPWILLWNGLRHGRVTQRIWIVSEMLAVLSFGIVAVFVLDVFVLRYHVICMLLGECMTAFFAVWTVHHDCDRDSVFARTSTGKWKNRLTFNMFLHLEHHLFPAVPTCNLNRLAERLHKVAADLRGKDVF